MKVLGFGWIKSGDTLKKALEEYGIKEGIVKGNPEGKTLSTSVGEVKKNIKQTLSKKEMRKSAKPRLFRVVLEEIEM